MLYVSGLGATSVGVAALSTAVNDARFAGIILGLLLVGFATSWGIRAGLVRGQLMERAILLVLGGILAAMFAMPDLKYEFLPPSAFASADNAMTSMLAWLMVVYSFNLRSDRAVVFICVPALSLIGLVSTFGPNAEIITYFVMFICFTSFALIEQNALSARERRDAGPGSVKKHAAITAVTAVAAGAIGILVGQVLFRSVGGRITALFIDPRRTPVMESLIGGDFMPVCAGPVALSDAEVMTVRCQEGLLWRAQVFDTYTGRGWTNTTYEWEQDPLAERRAVALQSAGGRMVPLDGYVIPWNTERFGVRSKIRMIQQTFRTVRVPMALIYGAAEPEFVAFHKAAELRMSGGSLRARHAYGPQDPYTVISAVAAATRSDLENAGTDYPEFVSDRYREVSPACWQIWRITENVTDGLTNPYDKVLAIQRFLEKEYVYDASAPAAPMQEDAVTYFLLKSRRGYCDVFASAMAIMCRQAGVPARVVSGFATGVYESEDGLFHIRQRDRHAWPEIYFPTYGWIAFDPAPSEGRPGLLARAYKVLAGTYRAVPSGGPATLTVVLLFVLALYLFKTELVDRLRKKPRWGSSLPAAAGRAVQNYYRMCRLLARLGYPRHPALTPLEYTARLAGMLPQELRAVLPAAEAVTSDFVQTRYALRVPPEGRVAASTELLEEFARSLRRLRRTRGRARADQ